MQDAGLYASLFDESSADIDLFVSSGRIYYNSRCVALLSGSWEGDKNKLNASTGNHLYVFGGRLVPRCAGTYHKHY